MLWKKRSKFRVRLLFVAGFLLFLAQRTEACPCGCGAVGPLTLYPGETWKVQTGVASETIDGVVKADGRTAGSGDAESSTLLQLGVARALTEDLALSANVAAKRDYQSAVGSEWSAVDPTVGLRYTALQVNYDRPWIPQVQLFASYRYALDNVRAENYESKFGVDSVNASEFAPGADLWFYTGDWAFGLSETLLLRRSVRMDGMQKRIRSMGLGQRSSLALSYTFMGYGQVMATLEREGKGLDTLGGETVFDSDKVENAVGLTGNVRIGDRKTLSLNGKLVGKFGQNKNARSARTMSLSYIQAF